MKNKKIIIYFIIIEMLFLCSTMNSIYAACMVCSKAATLTEHEACMSPGSWRWSGANHVKTCCCGRYTLSSHVGSYSKWSYKNSTSHSSICTKCRMLSSTQNHVASVEATCTKGPYCSTCSHTFGEALGHDYSTTWSSNETMHWKACTRRGCTAQSENSSHTFDKSHKCTVCGYQGKSSDVGTTCTNGHNFIKGYNGYYHWDKCTKCKKEENIVDHVWKSKGDTHYCTGCEVESHTMDYDFKYGECQKCGLECNHFHSGQEYRLKGSYCTEGEGVVWGKECYTCNKEIEVATYTEHEAGNEIVYNKDNHSYSCVHCGYYVEEEHEFVNGKCIVCKTECQHSYSAATCEKPRTCRNCEATDGKALEHNWQAATCEKPKTCKRCKKTEGSKLGHDEIPATCTEKIKCKRCLATSGNPLGHEYGTTWESNETMHWRACTRRGCTAQSEKSLHIVGAATCTSGGKCEVCGYTGKNLGHNYKEESYVKTSKEHTLYIKCTRCDSKMKGDTSEHVWNTSHKCTDCGYQGEHSYVGATCTSGGKCVCGATINGGEHELVNTFQKLSQDGSKHQKIRKCKHCDYIAETVTEAHLIDESTLKITNTGYSHARTGKCKLCGYNNVVQYENHSVDKKSIKQKDNKSHVITEICVCGLENKDTSQIENHDFEITVQKVENDTEKHEVKYLCKVCEYELTIKSIHIFENGICKCGMEKKCLKHDYELIGTHDMNFYQCEKTYECKLCKIEKKEVIMHEYIDKVCQNCGRIQKPLVRDLTLNVENDLLEIIKDFLFMKKPEITKRIMITPDSLKMTTERQTLTVKEIIIGGEEIAIENGSIGWSSSNPNVATVSGGVVTPRNEGKCTITARHPTLGAASCSVEVIKKVSKSDELLANINENNNVLNLTLEETIHLATNTPNYSYVAFYEDQIKALLEVEGVEIFPIKITKPEGEYVLIANTLSQDFVSMWPMGSVEPGLRNPGEINTDTSVSNFNGQSTSKTVTIPETTYVNGIEIKGGTELYKTFYPGQTSTKSKIIKLTTGDEKTLELTPVNAKNAASVRSVMCISDEETINYCVNVYQRSCFAIRFTGPDGKQYVQVAIAAGGRTDGVKDYNGKYVTAANTSLASNEGELIINDLFELANLTEKQEVPVIIPEVGKEKENKEINTKLHESLYYNVEGYNGTEPIEFHNTGTATQNSGITKESSDKEQEENLKESSDKEQEENLKESSDKEQEENLKESSDKEQEENLKESSDKEQEETSKETSDKEQEGTPIPDETELISSEIDIRARMDDLLENIKEDNVLNLTLEETVELVTNTPNYNFVGLHKNRINAILKVEGVEIFPIKITKPEGQYVLIAPTLSQDYVSMYPIGSIKPGRRHSDAVNTDSSVTNFKGARGAKTVTIPETIYVNGIEIKGGTELYETFYPGLTFTGSNSFTLKTGDGKSLYITPVNGRNVASIRSVMCLNGEKIINSCVRYYERSCFAIRFTGPDGKQYVQVAIAVGGRIGYAKDYNGKDITAANTSLAPNEGELIINDLYELANSTVKQKIPVVIPEKGKEKENTEIARAMYHDLFYNVEGYEKVN